MMTAEYRGAEHPELRGKEALVRPDPEQQGRMLAQFDEYLVSGSLPETRGEFLMGKEPEEPTPGLLWFLGWHSLPAEDFHRYR